MQLACLGVHNKFHIYSLTEYMALRKIRWLKINAPNSHVAEQK